MVVLITGATGLLGPYVVRSLVPRQTVRCLIHTPGTERFFNDSSIEIRYGDILDKDALAEASYGVNRVIHLANHNSFYKAPQEFYNSPDVNLLGTSNLLDICRSKPAFDHFILVSTLRSSRDPKSGPMYNKWCNEEQVRNSGIPYTILRSSILFGQSDSFINPIASAIRSSPIIPILGSGHNRIQPLAAEDLARCISLTLDRGDLKKQTLDLGGPDHISYNAIVDLVSEQLGKNQVSVHLPAWILKPILSVLDSITSSYPRHLYKFNSKAERNVTDPKSVHRYFGFTPRPLNGNIDYVNLTGNKRS